MILVQIDTNTLTSWRNYLQDGNQIAQIIGTIMVVIYVIYTYKTFRQIKKQTDYQQDAYLRVDTAILKELTIKKEGSLYQFLEIKGVTSSLPENYINAELHSKLKSILQPIFNFEDNLFEGNYFTVIMTNYGNAEVNKICLQLIVQIRNSKELVEKKMLREKEQQIISIEINEIIARTGGQIKIPLLSTASFPFYEITITGHYIDVRNKKYPLTQISMIGENSHFHKLP